MAEEKKTFERGILGAFLQSRIYWLILIILSADCSLLISQQAPASPANWLYPDGNTEGTKNVATVSARQIPDSLKVKWSTPFIKGDVQPLIGNMINDGSMISTNIWGTNEIGAVVGGRPVVIDARGFAHASGSAIPFVKCISVLIDTLSKGPGRAVTAPVVMGLESIESENPVDSLAFAYIAAYSASADSIALIKRVALDLRPYKPNIFASIKPVFGRREGQDLYIYAVLNMSHPVDGNDSVIAPPPYVRGLTNFNTGKMIYNFPYHDLGDDYFYRITLGPEVNAAQPSISMVSDSLSSILLPAYPTIGLNTPIPSPIDTTHTYGSKPYLAGFNISTTGIRRYISPIDLSAIADSNKPLTRPYYVHLTDSDSQDSVFILLAEGYKGIDGSHGTGALHLFSADGKPLTNRNLKHYYPFKGMEDHLWSVATGNVDGNDTNALPPYYPNNPGNEIIVTFSTKDFAVAGNRLCVLRYKSGKMIEKISPPQTYLNRFDTIATQKINGWVAAVNDLDGTGDGKAEIVLVDGSTVRVMRMKNYKDFYKQKYMPFDTVASFRFGNQTIASAEVADIEGDGYNDLIVTTEDSTYVIGTAPRANTLDVIYPVTQADPPESFCLGDTVRISWTNEIETYGGVNIYFQPYVGGQPSGSEILIRKSSPNLSDTVTYYYVSDQRVAGKEGRFLIRSESYPALIHDSTAILKFEKPGVVLNALNEKSYVTGSTITLNGTSICADSALVEYSYPGGNWHSIYSGRTNPDGSYTCDFEIPCLSFFSCDSADSRNLIYFRAIGTRNVFRDTSGIVGAIVLPYPLNISIDSDSGIATTKRFTWNSSSLKYSCDSIDVSVSTDAGYTYNLIDRIAASSDKYEWQVRTDLSQSIIFRFCCENSCVRADTLLSDYKPKYISVVAPNPFKPGLEQAEVVYTVPKETTVTIKILDENNRLVAEPVSSQPRSPGIAYSDYWSGILNSGSYAANGQYYIVLEMSDGSKEVYPIFVRK